MRQMPRDLTAYVGRSLIIHVCYNMIYYIEDNLSTVNVFSLQGTQLHFGTVSLKVRHLYSEGQFEVMPISHGVRILLVYPDSLDLPTPPRLYLNPPLLNLP